MNYSYKQANDYILDIPRFTSKNEPEKTRAFLEYLGDISLSVPTIHVAGTNGKGSVCAYLCSAFKKAGYRAAMFTSPHLVSIRERFICDEKMISREDFTFFFNEVLRKVEDFNNETNGNYHPTYFEFLFFMGVLYFQSIKPDVLVLETGLGGRLDATNSISSPKVCVITEIGLDHMEYLGESVDKIALEKAGIIKEGIPVVYVNKEVSGQVIKEHALKLSSESYAIDSNSYEIIKYATTGIDFLLSSRYHKNVNLTVASFAPYQVENAVIAFQTLEVFSEKCKEILLPIEAIIEGIKAMKWPGRMEGICENFFIDGAHNEDGINAFLETVQKVPSKRRFLLYSAVSDKNVEKITGKIIDSGLFEGYYVAVLDSYRAADMARLKECFKAVQSGAEYFNCVKDALDKMLEDATEETMCFAAGSLYLVGEVKRIINDKL